jgi:predicted N-formylglutamate amidohydrolase
MSGARLVEMQFPACVVLVCDHEGNTLPASLPILGFFAGPPKRYIPGDRRLECLQEHSVLGNT